VFPFYWPAGTQECVDGFTKLGEECEAAGWSDMGAMCKVRRVLGWVLGLSDCGASSGLHMEGSQRHASVLQPLQSLCLPSHTQAVTCGSCPLHQIAPQENIKYAISHRDVVQQWGRFPHRNAILGRESTPEEAAGIAAGTIPKW